MARPKKANSTDMLRIVDSFYETHGDASRLRFTLLEEYAASLGISIKEYDFRRDESVKKRIDEIKSLQKTAGLSLAYKTLDADALIRTNPTRESLKNALIDLDGNWRAVYERAAKLSAENSILLSENYSIKRDAEALRSEIALLNENANDLRRESVNLLAENRYLKSALERWLYPDVANEILKREGVLPDVDPIVSEAAVEDLTDLIEPVSLDQIVTKDSERITRAQGLINRMKSQINRS